jgi:hypothetical protein
MFSNPNVSQCFLASAQAEFNLEFGAKNTVIIPDFVISEDNCIASALTFTSLTAKKEKKYYFQI